MSYLEDLYTRYMNGELINLEDPSLYDNSDGNNPIYGTPVQPTGKSMYPSKSVTGFDSANSSKPVDLNALISKSGNGGSSVESDSDNPVSSAPIGGGYTSDGGASTQATANSIAGTGDLARNHLQNVLSAKDVNQNPWVTSDSLMQKLASFKPSNTKEIAYKNLMDNLPSLVSGGSWLPAVNQRMIALSNLIQKAQSDSLVESANIDDGIARNQLASEIYGSLRNGKMTNPLEYASLSKMLENIGAGKYNPTDVSTLFMTSPDQSKLRQTASATAISDDNTQKSLAQAYDLAQQQMANARAIASMSGSRYGSSSNEKFADGLLKTAMFAKTSGTTLSDPKDVAKTQMDLKQDLSNAMILGGDYLEAVAQAGVIFSQAHGLQKDAEFYSRYTKNGNKGGNGGGNIVPVAQPAQTTNTSGFAYDGFDN